jgi:hypothetical protein
MQVACGLVVAGVIIMLGVQAIRWLSVAMFAVAAGCLVLYLWRARFRTRLTPRGMELRGYFNKFVPWDSIRDIQVLSYDTVDDVPVAGWSGRPVAGKAGSNRNLVAVRVYRQHRPRLQLRVPLVTGTQEDPEFDHKVQQIKERWHLAVTGQAHVPPSRR